MEINTTVTYEDTMYTAHVATIESTMLGDPDHGIFTATLGLRWASSGVSLGGYCLDEPVKDAEGHFLGREGTAFGLDHIMKMIETAGASSWERLKGMKILVLFPLASGGSTWGSSPVGMAGLDNGKVLIFKAHAAQWLAREGDKPVK